MPLRRAEVPRHDAGPEALNDPQAMAAWRLDALWAELEPLWPGLQLQWLPEVGSTNTALLEAARRGDDGPCLLIAERQTAGRGRLGRAWQSDWAAQALAPAGASTPDALTCSLRIGLQRTDLSGLSLAVGLALAESLDARIGLKWPNDLLLADEGDMPGTPSLGRKLGGILIETTQAGSARQVVIGFGLNLATPPQAAGLGPAAAGLRELDPAARAPQVLRQVAAPLLRLLREFETSGFAPLRTRYAARDCLAGRPVRVLQSGAEPGDAPAPEVRALGVDEQGFLMVQTPAGVQRIGSGEVSVRPC